MTSGVSVGFVHAPGIADHAYVCSEKVFFFWEGGVRERGVMFFL